MPITPLKNNIIFKFVDDTDKDGLFTEPRTASGIIISKTFDKTAKSPRWAVVEAIGGECKEVQVGDQILLPALRWTAPTKVDDQRVWKTDESQVTAILRNDKFIPLNKYVVFTPIAVEPVVTASGLFVLTSVPENTPTGIVAFVADDCFPGLVGCTIVYSDTNFFEHFDLGSDRYAFLREDEIIAYIPLEE